MSIVKSLLVILSCTLFVGCQQDRVKAPPVGIGDQLPIHAYPQIVAAEGLAGSLRFSQPIVTATDGQRPMRVTVPLRSIYDKYPVNIQYKFEFFDDAGRAMGANPGWHFKHLEPRLQTQLQANALDSRAVDWRLTLRSAR